MRHAKDQKAERRTWRSPAAIGAAVVLGGSVLGFLAPTLSELAEVWYREPAYHHAFLVPVFAAYLLWHRRRQAADVAFQPCGWGLLWLAVGVGMHVAGKMVAQAWVTQAAGGPLGLGFFVTLGGRPAYRWALPVAVFLIFLVPLPATLGAELRDPLCRLVTGASVYALQTLGYPARADGNLIVLQQEQIGIAEASSGLSMFVMVVALSTAVAFLVERRPPWDKLLVLVSAVPIALACHVARVTATVALYVTVGHTLGELVPIGGALGACDLYDVTGWLMLPAALGL